MNQEPVKEEEGRTMAKIINAFAYLECSAKRKEGVKVTYSRFSWCQTQKYSDSLPHSNKKFAQSVTFSFSIKNAEKVYDRYWRLIHSSHDLQTELIQNMSTLRTLFEELSLLSDWGQIGPNCLIGTWEYSHFVSIHEYWILMNEWVFSTFHILS